MQFIELDFKVKLSWENKVIFDVLFELVIKHQKLCIHLQGKIFSNLVYMQFFSAEIQKHLCIFYPGLSWKCWYRTNFLYINSQLKNFKCLFLDWHVLITSLYKVVVIRFPFPVPNGNPWNPRFFPQFPGILGFFKNYSCYSFNQGN